MTEFTYHVGEKFHPDGTVRAYPGVTIICFADPDTLLYKAGEQIQAHLQEQPYARKLALLPPSSFHMTVFSLILDQDRQPDYWTPRLSVDAPLEQVDQFFIAAVGGIPVPQKLRMCLTFISGRGLSFRLSPADGATYIALREYREQLSSATGVRYPDHISYEFHLTLAYQLIELNPDEERAFEKFRYDWGEMLRCAVGVFEAPAPVLTFFDDMFRFVPVSERRTLESRKQTIP